MTRVISHFDHDPYLAYRTLSRDANLAEYQEETETGEIIKPAISRTGEKVKYKLVTFTIDDPENPKNWGKVYKWWITMVIAVLCFIVALCSSVITAGIGGVEETFDVSRSVALLSITLFVFGFGLGPMVFAPLSEVLGRRIIYVATFGISIIFIIPCAVAKNIETLLVCRAICGIAMSAPMTLVSLSPLLSAHTSANMISGWWYPRRSLEERRAWYPHGLLQCCPLFGSRDWYVKPIE